MAAVTERFGHGRVIPQCIRFAHRVFNAPQMGDNRVATPVMHSAKMNAEATAWSRRYGTALRRYLDRGPSADPRPALRLGRRAVALGMQTLDVVGIHEQVLTMLAPLGGSPRDLRGMADRARTFFAEAIVPIEETHRAAREAGARVNRLTQVLRRRTREALARRRQLERGIAQRQAAEAALRKSGKHRAALLAEARRLQAHLRHLAREILSAQEVERRETSRQLHDEVAQALLAVNVRLLTLRMAAKVSIRSLKKEVAETQRLVKESRKTIHRLSHGSEGKHET